MSSKPHIARQTGWMLLIILAAVALRLYDLPGTPPGLTHDEADHGITAWGIVNGVRDIYFTVGYGREPLFDYSTAMLMKFLGPTYLAARLTAVFFGLVIIAGTAAWVRQAFNAGIALMTAAGIAVGFWAVMTSRQSLRSVALPALFTIAFYFFWRALAAQRQLGADPHSPSRLASGRHFLMAGLLLGLTFYTYIPSRIMWAVFPAILGYLALIDKPLFRRMWAGTAGMLLLAALVGSPLFYYLFKHPAAETRIGQLSAPLSAAAGGDFGPLLTNSWASLKLFTITGDSFWRYNIPDRPFLGPLMGICFYIGIAASVWGMWSPRNRQQTGAAYAAALFWLTAGFAPTLVTGPALSTTQAIGMQPVLYLFPALGLAAIHQVASSSRLRQLFQIGLLLLFTGTAFITARDYFIRWAKAPEVRVQYESSMAAAMAFINEQGLKDVAISTITPGRFHTPAIAQMIIRDTSVLPRYFDGRHSLSLPSAEDSYLVVPGFASLSPFLDPYLGSAVLVDTIPLPETDLDRPLNIYRLSGPRLAAEWQAQFRGALNPHAVTFGGSAQFLGYTLSAAAAAPGDSVNVATLWRVQAPLADAILFTHVQGAGGAPIAQADRLDVPGESWQPGDLFIQLHQLTIPADTAGGEYPIAVGLCQGPPENCTRLPAASGIAVNDMLPIGSVQIIK